MHVGSRMRSKVGVEDLVLLTHPSDKAIEENLRLRHANDLLYTNIGSVLLAVNPFKQIDHLYSKEQIEYYRGGGVDICRCGGVMTTLGGPHIFALAEETYRAMVADEEDQCIIISGESGAGKTEASKQIMQYITAVSGNVEDMQRVKHVILESNPLMEAFGNAKTLRNDNSSRFGKFFQIYFDAAGRPVGGNMASFLLEKSRVVAQQHGECNFHVFYQLCAGATTEQRSKFGLKEAEMFYYLNQGGVSERDNFDDESGWLQTMDAMRAMKMSEAEQDAVMEVLGLILHLGEITFADPLNASTSSPCTISNPSELEFCATKLQVEADALERALTWKKLVMGGSEIVHVPLDLQQCRNTRDAVAKAIYGHLFEYVVACVNAALGSSAHSMMLGVLDIYGFEVFERNGFEQFCINYVNEKLQQIFIELTLRVEQEEYVREGIPWEEVPFFNNNVVCSLMEGTAPPGLFLILDDVCMAMAKEAEYVADIKMLDKLDAIHSRHPHYRRTENGFSVKHYAGEVPYDAAGFTNRNKDMLGVDAMSMLATTRNPFLRRLLEALLPESETSKCSAGDVAGRPKRATTAGFKIRRQAADLVRTLFQCTPHYVRTIKPNDEKRPGYMDEARVMHQVKYLGLLENVRVRRAGYSYRQYFDKFVKRFRYICPATFPRPFAGNDREACAAILQSANHILPSSAWQLGTSKVFIRQPFHLAALEDARDDAFGRIAGKIQKTWMRYLNRRVFIRLKSRMDRLYRRQGKARRADSVFRPFQGDYMGLLLDSQELKALLQYDPVGDAWKEYQCDQGTSYYHNFMTDETQWEKPLACQPQKVIFAAPAKRVADHDSATVEESHLIVTNRAIYLIQQLSVFGDTSAEGGWTGCSAIAPFPLKPLSSASATPLIRLLKRVPLMLLSGISFTCLADDVIVLHVYPVPAPYRPLLPTPATTTTCCEICSVEFTVATRKRNCPCCGRLCCIKRCMVNRRPLPSMLGHALPVRVCPCCVVGEPLEPLEDIVLRSIQKTELAAVLCRTYRHLMGSDVPLHFSNKIVYKVADAAHNHTITAVEAGTSYGSDTTMQMLDNHTILVNAPPGIPPRAVRSIEAARELRRLRAAELRRQEEAEERAREALREKAREAAHNAIVAERKKRKAEDAEREAQARIVKELAQIERRQAVARTVAERSRRQ